MSLNKTALSHLWDKISSFFVAKKEGYDLISDDEKASIKNDIALNKSALGLQKKNLFNISQQQYTLNGITFTVNSDGSVHVYGTATAKAHRQFNSNTILKANVKYKCSGCPEGAGLSTFLYQFNYYKNGTQYAAYDYGDGVDYITDQDFNVTMYITIMSGQTVDLLFYPMIRYADIEDDTYEPFVDDLQTQTTANAANIFVCKSTLGTECVNLFNPTDVNWYDATNISIDSDGVITSTVTSDNRDIGEYSCAEYKITLPAGTYSIVYRCTSYTSGTARIVVFIDGVYATEVGIASTGTRSSTFMLAEESEVALSLKLWSQTCTIMIKNANITDNTFVPYTPNLQSQINNILARLDVLEGGS